jgi:pyridoxine 4-dehydrogenase
MTLPPSSALNIPDRRTFLTGSAATLVSSTIASPNAIETAPLPSSIILAGEDAGTTTATTSLLSKSPLKLPPIGLGCWSWGDSLFWGYNPKNDANLQDVFNYATSSRNVPILFDSAEIYGFGRSESLLGEYSRTLTNPKDVVIATKFAALPWRTTPESVLKACLASTNRLGRPIDLYQIHFPNAYANAAYWDGMAMAYEQGLIRAVGVSNYGVDAVRACHKALAKRGVPLSTNQIQYSLLYQHPEKSNGLLQCCKDLGMEVLAYSPLALGLLTGKYTNVESVKSVSGPRRTLFETNVSNPQFATIINAMKEVANNHADVEATIPQVAINWCIAKGTIPIPGARTLSQVKSNYSSLDWKMSEGEIQFLDKASSGFSYIDPSLSPFPRVDKDTGLIMFDS